MAEEINIKMHGTHFSNFPITGNNTEHPQLKGEVLSLTHSFGRFSPCLAGYKAGRAWWKGLAKENYSCHGSQEAKSKRKG